MSTQFSVETLTAKESPTARLPVCVGRILIVVCGCSSALTLLVMFNAGCNSKARIARDRRKDFVFVIDPHNALARFEI